MKHNLDTNIGRQWRDSLDTYGALERARGALHERGLADGDMTLSTLDGATSTAYARLYLLALDADRRGGVQG